MAIFMLTGMKTVTELWSEHGKKVSIGIGRSFNHREKDCHHQKISHFPIKLPNFVPGAGFSSRSQYTAKHKNIILISYNPTMITFLFTVDKKVYHEKNSIILH
jgi:hypothetical protein